MMKKLAGFLLSLLLVQFLQAQRNCVSHEYAEQLLQSDPSLKQKVADIEAFTNRNANQTVTVNDYPGTQAGNLNTIIVPVVVHVLYRQPEENISDASIQKQIEILNRDFRKLNADTANIPTRFLNFAADINIEFRLATRDPKGVASNGIVRKYTPIRKWSMDDKMKFDEEMGSTAWDAASYLNIWVCNMDEYLGYASFPGTPLDRDGVVINFKAFGVSGYFSQYNKGRTTVHEVGHWLNLRHIWGDADCGDDGVGDTPQQRSYTPGCPSGIRVTCGNSSNGGDMYMNYMDFTSDACVNMFTFGQRQRMRSLFEPGGARASILTSRGLDAPLVEGSALPDVAPRWLHIKLYPNPVRESVTLDFKYDIRWVGRSIRLIDMNGIIVKRLIIDAPLYQINTSQLKPGIYILEGEKDGEKLLEKFVKM